MARSTNRKALRRSPIIAKYRPMNPNPRFNNVNKFGIVKNRRTPPFLTSFIVSTHNSGDKNEERYTFSLKKYAILRSIKSTQKTPYFKFMIDTPN